ncbi:BTB/POZ domain-containing protein KCTD7 isoform X1 [Ursus maritimus]|uniref:BTB/POZ domain-containing protein KCTD7 n=4 Tax=Ursus TaxID=9639 RepID=A0A8M1G5M4_URSMA|nr:BTB/POZ domain-containing protein KCTD7 isoform X1 [Ursus maritimus]
MVVVTGREPDSRRPDGAMSSSDAEDDFLEPATPTATQAGHALPLLPQEFPEVVPLNIGGAHFTTRLSTLRRYEDTMLAAMFSGRHYIPTDAEGRYFIDRDGTHFGDVLNFLRSGDLPPRERVRAVYKEAQYYAIGPLLEQLENMQPLKGEKVRQAFLGLMPYYKDHLERIVEIARLRAVQRKARFAKLKVCVFKEEMPITPYECPLLNSLRFERSDSDGQLFEHHCEVDVSFGPWEAVADVYDLLHCLVTDLSAQGLIVDHQCIGVCDKHLINHYYCKRPIYEFKITWWEREMALSLCEPQWLRPFLEENGRELPFLRKQSLTPSWIMSVLIKMSLGVTSWITLKGYRKDGVGSAGLCFSSAAPTLPYSLVWPTEPSATTT